VDRILRFGLQTLLAISTLSLGGCAIVEKQAHFVPTSEIGKKRETYEATVIHTNIEPHAAQDHRAGVQFSTSVRGWRSSTILIGPLLPVIPGFLFNWFLASDSRSDTLVVYLRVTTKEEKVTLRPGDMTARVVGSQDPLHPMTVKIRGFRKVLSSHPETTHVEREYVDCPPSITLPSDQYDDSFGRGDYSLVLQYVVAGFAEATGLDLSMDGIAVNGKDEPPLSVAFEWRSGWEWVLAGP